MYLNGSHHPRNFSVSVRLFSSVHTSVKASYFLSMERKKVTAFVLQEDILKNEAMGPGLLGFYTSVIWRYCLQWKKIKKKQPKSVTVNITINYVLKFWHQETTKLRRKYILLIAWSAFIIILFFIFIVCCWPYVKNIFISFSIQSIERKDLVTATFLVVFHFYFLRCIFFLVSNLFTIIALHFQNFW